MLIKTEVEKTKFIYKNEILINKKVIDYFNTNNLINIENIIDKLNFKIMDLTEVAKILNLIKKEDLPIIIKQMLSTKNINTKEITKFLIDNNINLDDFFNKMYLNVSLNVYSNNKTIPIIQFSENDLKLMIKNRSLKTSFLLTQENIDFFIKDDTLCNRRRVDKILLNENLKYETLNTFLEKRKHMINQSQKMTLTLKSKYNTKIIENHQECFNFSSLPYNKHLTEDMIKKYIKKSDYIKIQKGKVSKEFLKNNIDFLNYNFIFSNLENEKEYEHFFNVIKIKFILNDSPVSDLKNEIVINILSRLKKEKNLNYEFFEKILDDNNIELDIAEKLMFFNENTTEKHFHYFEKLLNNKYDYVDNKSKKDMFYNALSFVISQTNIPNKIIEKNIHLLKNDNNNKKEYNSEFLIKHQILPNKILNDRHFISYLKKSESIVLLQNQIKNKKELNFLLENNGYCKKTIKKEEIIKNLLKNIIYLSNFGDAELNSFLKEENIENINFIFSCMVKNQNKKDYGLSLF